MTKKDNYLNGRSAGQVVMGEDLFSRGCGFESQHWILDGHFSHQFVAKIAKIVYLKKTENEQKSGLR